MTSKETKYVFLLVFVITLLYAITIPQNLSETDDVYAFAYQAENSSLTDFSDPRLLLYHFSVRLLYISANRIGLELSALNVMRGVSFVSSIFCLFLFYSILLRMNATIAGAIAGTACLALSYGYWRYSVEGDVYALASALTLLTLSYALKSNGGRFRGVWLGMLGAISILFYQPVAIALLIAMPFYFVISNQIRIAIIYVACGALFLVGGYVVAYFAYLQQTPSLIEFFHFVSTRVDEFAPPPLTIRNLISSAIQGFLSVGSNVLAANWLFGFESFSNGIREIFGSKFIHEEIFAAKQFDHRHQVSAVTFCILSAASLVLIWLARVQDNYKEHLRDPIVLMFICWLSGVSVVIIRFNPSSVEAWLLALPPTLFLISRLIFDPLVTRKKFAVIGAFLVVFGFHNYVAGLSYVQDPAFEFDRLKADWLIRNAEKSDLVVLIDNTRFADSIRYLSPAQVAVVDKHSVKRLGRSFYLIKERQPIYTYGRQFRDQDATRLIRNTLTAEGNVFVFDDIVKTLREKSAIITRNDQYNERLLTELLPVNEQSEFGTLYAYRQKKVHSE